MAEDLNGEVCYANVGGAQRGVRLGFGVAMAIGAVALGVVLFSTGAPPLARMLVAPLVWLAAIGILQYRGRT